MVIVLRPAVILPFFFVMAFASEAQRIYVDPRAGLDTNPGDAAQPLKTVAAAVNIAGDNRRLGISTTITLRPGVYRESIHLVGQGPADAPAIVLQADKTGAAIITGSDRWGDSQEDPSHPARYSHPWPYKWGACQVPAGWPGIQPLGLRREMIFVNGELLAQVLSLQDMRAAAFFIDEAGDRVYLWPPAGVDLPAAAVEVAVRPVLFESNGASNLTLRGLVFEHANSCIGTKPGAAVMISGGSHVIVEDAAFRWNNWIGLDLFSLTGSLIRRTAANDNGELGINAFRLKDATFEDVEASRNNWRGGGLGKLFTWEPSGAKLLRIHGAQLERFTAIGNQGRGLWFDTDNSDIEIRHAYLAANQTGGIDLEASAGPITIANSRICSNGREGVQGNQSESVKLIDNIIYDNQRAQIWVSVTSKPRADTNWESKEKFAVLARNWTIVGNTIVGANATEFLYQGFVFIDPTSGPFLSTLIADHNTWYNPANAEPFQLDTGAFKRLPKNVDFAAWKEATGQDAHSKFGPPAASPAGLCEGLEQR